MQTIFLDVSNKGVSPVIYAKQDEVGRRFSAYITDAGVPYNIPADSLISVWYSGKGGDGNYTHIGENSAFSIDGNVVTVELIAQMLQSDGPGSLCLVINSSDGSQIGLWNIQYFVEGVPGSDSEEAREYYTAFSKDIEKLYKMFGGEPGGGGGSGESNTVFVTADLSTMTASMTGTEIEEAIDSGKVAVLLNAKTNAVMCTLKPMTSEETAEGRRAAVMGTMLESLGGGLKEDVLNGNASWNNVISAAILIDPESNISMGDTFCMLPPPAPEDTNKIPMIVSGDSDGIKWVDPATMPSLKGEPGESVTITHIAESDGDGAINMVAFSDGKTMTIKNGSKGSPGITPHIGENGNWWVGETDTGVSASGGGVTVEDVLAALPTWTGGSY